MIIFIPNDPLAKVGPDKRKIKPHAKRAAGGADFVFNGVAKEVIHDISTPEFLFWQCREAALRAVEVWETIDGKLKAWGTSSPKKLALTPNAGFQLNAGYTQAGLDFYEFTTGTKARSVAPALTWCRMNPVMRFLTCCGRSYGPALFPKPTPFTKHSATAWRS